MTELKSAPPVVIHACPLPGSGMAPCCGKPVFELDRRDRITLVDEYVTCDERNKDLVEEMARSMFGARNGRQWDTLSQERKNVWLVRASRALNVVRVRMLEKYIGSKLN